MNYRCIGYFKFPDDIFGDNGEHMCILLHMYSYIGPGSSVGITTGYGLDGPGIEYW